MGQEDFYRQVELRHLDGRVDVCYIPQKLAKSGKWLKIDEEDGWQVTACYSSRKWIELDNERSAQRYLEDNLDPHR